MKLAVEKKFNFSFIRKAANILWTSNNSYFCSDNAPNSKFEHTLVLSLNNASIGNILLAGVFIFTINGPCRLLYFFVGALG